MSIVIVSLLFLSVMLDVQLFMLYQRAKHITRLIMGTTSMVTSFVRLSGAPEATTTLSTTRLIVVESTRGTCSVILGFIFVTQAVSHASDRL
jgi:hypothetical protein